MGVWGFRVQGVRFKGLGAGGVGFRGLGFYSRLLFLLFFVMFLVVALVLFVVCWRFGCFWGLLVLFSFLFCCRGGWGCEGSWCWGLHNGGVALGVKGLGF